MDVTIIKYRESDIDNRVKNYFDFPISVDSIHLTQCMIEGFPIYSEEIDNQDTAMSVIAGNFTIRFSLLQTDLSENGKNILKFFESDADTRNNLFIIGVKINGKNILGKIIPPNIKIDLNPRSDGWFVELNCIELTTELRNYLDTRYLQWLGTPIPDHTLFDDFLLSQYFNSMPAYCHRINNLNTNTRCGFNVYFSSYALSYTIMYNYPNLTVWNLLDDLQRGIGINWKLEWDGTTVQLASLYFNTNLIFFWKTEGINEFTGFKIAKHEVGFVDFTENIKMKLLIDYEFAVSNGSEQGYHNVLALYNDDHRLPDGVNPANGSELMNCYHHTTENKWRTDTPLWNFYENEMTKITLQAATQRLIYTASEWGYDVAISFSRMLHNGTSNHYEGFPTIIEKTALPEMKFLMRGLRMKKDLKIYTGDFMNLKIFNRMNIEGNYFWINRIRNLDIMKQECDAEIIEC